MKPNISKCIFLLSLFFVFGQAYAVTTLGQLKQILRQNQPSNNPPKHRHKQFPALGVDLDITKCNLVNFKGNLPDVKPIKHMTFSVYGSGLLKKPDIDDEFITMSNTIHFFHDNLDEVTGVYYLEFNKDTAFFVDKVIKDTGTYISRYKCDNDALKSI